MIYTSYFGKIKSLPDNFIPISICGKAPNWYNGLQYKKLAPKLYFYIKWRENHDNDYYTKCFKEQVLDRLDANTVVMELKHLCHKSVYEDINIVLLCYEKPSDFCHRHLVAEWLIDNGFECEEFKTQ